MEVNDKRTSIINAAFYEFTEKGFHAAKMVDISNRAGVGKGTIYEYFTNKEALLIAVLEAGIQAYTELLLKSKQTGKTAWGKLQNLFNTNRELTNQDQQFTQLIINNFGLVDKQLNQLLQEKQRELESLISGILQEGIESGEIRQIPIHTASRAVFCLLFAYHESDRLVTESDIKELLDILGNGLLINK